MKHRLPILLAAGVLLSPAFSQLSEASADNPKVVVGFATENAVFGYSTEGDIHITNGNYYYGYCGRHHCRHRCRYVPGPHHKAPPHHKRHHKHHKKEKKHHHRKHDSGRHRHGHRR